MQSETSDNEVQNTLPPMITNNIREKINPEQVPLELIIIPKEKHDQRKKIKHMQPILTRQILSSYPLNVVYYPKLLKYEIGDQTTVQNLRVWNASMRTLYVTCNGLQKNTEDNGAIWIWYPRIRSLLAPGLATTFYIKAIPKTASPVSSLSSELRLAAASKRDNVVTYFSVPLEVTFLNYTPICLPEAEDSEVISAQPSI